MAHLIFIENIQECMDKQLYNLGLFFDLTKAYNVINNEILLNKLKYYGITGTMTAWINLIFPIGCNFFKYLQLITQEDI